MRSLVLILALLLAVPSFAQEFLLPAAGNTPGANATHFRSEVTIWNFREANQRVLVHWLPQGSSGVDIPPVELIIGAFSVRTDEDFVGDVLKQQGLGAILFTAIRADGTHDTGSGLALRIKSRIWTPQPGTGGVTSQSFDAIPLASNPVANNFLITGQRNDDRYRLNVGIVNLDREHSHVFNMRHPFMTITVPAFSMQQVAVPRTESPQLLWRVSGPTNDLWFAYGSSVENISGDAWSSIGHVGPPLP